MSSGLRWLELFAGRNPSFTAARGGWSFLVGGLGYFGCLSEPDLWGGRARDSSENCAVAVEDFAVELDAHNAVVPQAIHRIGQHPPSGR